MNHTGLHQNLFVLSKYSHIVTIFFGSTALNEGPENFLQATLKLIFERNYPTYI